MRILGIDPALTVTGYGVIEACGDKVFLLEAGIIKTSPAQGTPRRLGKIYSSVTKLIAELKPEVVVLEKIYAHYRHPVTAYVLGQARGVICLAAEKSRLPLEEYAATRIKKAVIGRGLASKQQIKSMIAHIFSLKELPAYSDVTDALALAVAHSHIVKNQAGRGRRVTER